MTVWTDFRSLCLTFAGLIVGLASWSVCTTALADERAPHSVLILDQSTSFRPWPRAIIAGIRSSLSGRDGPPISVFVEHLDLYRFKGSDYEADLQRHLRSKYRDQPIGVIVIIGSTTLEFLLRQRQTLWPTVPVVFAAVDEDTAQHLQPGVTGTAMPVKLSNMIASSKALVPGLKGFAIVGDKLEQQPSYRHFAKELPGFAEELEFVDLTGLPIREVRQRVAGLPELTTILYVGINRDPDGTYVAAEVLPSIAEVANRPIVIDAETFLGSGATGGLILSPSQIGLEAGRLALRILDGENASDIPVTTGDFLRPVFDWRQLKRWNISEDRLPPNSEIRFRAPSMWSQYQVEISAFSIALLLQSALIFWLLYEHRRRQSAEIMARNTMTELTQMNRLATAGELSASIAHEVNQPLTGIVTKANAALRWLAADRPDVGKTRAALEQIVTAGHRASDIITSIRSMLRKDTNDKAPIDINNLIGSVLRLVWIDLRKQDIQIQTDLGDGLPSVIGNDVQLQQVILNLVMNATKSMHSVHSRVLTIKSARNGADGVCVSIEDTGIGFDPHDADGIFKPLFTTKSSGMGMGLAICRSIIENHDGRIWASTVVDRGSVFQFSLPSQR